MGVLRPPWRLPFALAATLALLALAATAFGYWSGTASHGEGNGTAGAATVAGGATPTVGELGSTTVVVTWGRSILSDGTAITGYVVKRYAEPGGTVPTISGGCSGTIAATTCTEAATPPGDWQYTVTPVIGTNWRGEESLKSGSVDTGPGSIFLDRELFGGTVAPLPATISGTISGFASNEAITYTLDHLVTLTASPTHVGPTGSATISLTVPAGTADGPHSIEVLGNTAEASAGIVVDTTAPTISTFLTPAPNAAGWNDTAPVEVDRTASDGTGSGLAYVKYTDDGSDPKTDPNGTARFVTAPVSVSTTTTLKYYQADLAGNLSTVLTQLVKIDAAPPVFAAALVNIQGGVFQGPPPSQGVPGIAYYRGAAAGSLRFRVTPVSIPGRSAAISAGFSALPPDAFGFSFDASAVTTPLGGPFVSNPMTWTAGTTSNPHGTISLTNEAGSTFGAAGNLVNDSTAPTGGSVDASGLVGTGGRYSTSLTLSLNLAKGTDAMSGLADATGPSDVPATLQRASATLSSSDGVANGTCGTYSADVQIAANPALAINDTVPTDRRCYRYRYLVPDHVGNIATYGSPDIKVIAVPAGSLAPSAATLSAATGTSAQSISGETVYYNPAQLGSFNVDSSSSAPYAGIAQLSFPAIAGFTGGGAVTSPFSGTTFRSTYAWSANSASPSPGAQAVTATNNAGETATNSSAFSVVKDSAGPSGGTVDATGLVGTGGRYSTSMTVSVGFTPGTDTGSGLASTGAQFLRASATLNPGGACGAFGAYTLIGLNDPTSPKSDTVPVDRTCYSYAYEVHDKVGNESIYTSPAVKVYAAAPAPPALSFSGFTNASWTGTGAAVFYRPTPGATSGAFTVTATSADAASYAFPTLPSGWSSSPGSFGSRNYSWTSASPTVSAASQNVTMTSNAGTTSSAGFTVTPDSTAPSGGSLTYTNGYTSGSAVSVTLVRGTDTGSGLASATGTVEVGSATLASGTCGTFGSYSTAATNPASPVSLPVAADTCYRYRYLTSDGVGNQVTYTSASIVKGDDAAPTDSITLINDTFAYFNGATLFFKGNSAGSFKLVNTVTDTGSGPASTTFPAIATAGWTHNAETVTTPTGGPYTSSTISWVSGASTPSPKGVVSTDLAGKTSNSGSASFQSDIAAPTGGSITYTTALLNTTSVPITTSAGTDALSGVDIPTIMRDSAPLNTTTETCGAWVGTYAATVTLVGGADTSVTSGNCYRYEALPTDNVGNVASPVTSASVVRVDTSGPRVTAIVSTDNDGRLESGDKLILTFNQSLTGVPASFSGATEIRPASGNVTLTIPGITQGAVGTGSAGYLSATGTATFGGTIAVTGSGTGTTATVTVSGTPTGATTAASSGILAFTTATTIKDGGGNVATGTFTTVAGFKLF